MIRRALILVLWPLTLMASLVLFAAPQDEAPTGDQFFAGMVVEVTPEQLTVARMLQGKNESRTFKLTPETKVEGRLAPKVRVTVRWVTTEDGDRATLVIVRPEPIGKGKK